MAWYSASWLYRFKITTDQTKVDEAIDNVYYDLANAPAGFWTHVKSDGSDIRVTRADEVTDVAREITGWSLGTTTGQLFFKATGLSASVNTEYYVYYGNSGASEPADNATYGKQNVWTSLLAVFHLDDSGPAYNSKNTTISAATENGGTFGTTAKLGAGWTGNAGGGGTAAQLNAGNNFPITSAALTVSFWINPGGFGNPRTVVVKQDPASNFNGYLVGITTAAEVHLLIGSASSYTDMLSNSSALTVGAFQHVVVTYDGANARFFVNGSAVGAPAGTLVPTDSGQTFYMGGWAGYFGISGTMDEVRVSTSVRSANWITTEFNNQNSPSTFWTTGAETQDAATPLTWLPRQQILRGPRGLMTPSGPVPPTRPEP